MNVQDAVHWGRRLFEGIARSTTDDRDVEEPTPGALWKKAYPKLMDGLEQYGKIEFGSLPESSLLPFRETKPKCQEELAQILDQLLIVVGVCGAADIRGDIRERQESIIRARRRIASIQRDMITAAAESSQGPLDGVLSPSREHLQEDIENEQQKIARCTEQIAGLKQRFRDHLRQIGLNVPDDQADSYLLAVEEDIVAMAAVIRNIGLLTEQLQTLVDQGREAHDETLRYYGCYVLLVLAVDRLENHFIARVDQELLPCVGGIETKAREAIAEAGTQIAGMGPIDILAGNIATNKTVIDCCKGLAEILTAQKRSIAQRNRETRIMLAAASNTFKTAKNSGELAGLIGECRADFQALRDLRLPPLRAFQNIQLTEQMQQLSTRVAKGE